MNYQIKDIEGFPGYRIDSEGFVWSCLSRTGKKGYKGTWKIIIGTNWKKLKPSNCKGYYFQGLHKDGKTFQKRINRLVAETFLPNPNNYPHVCHNNGIKNDNRLENLRWDSVKNNHKDKWIHGTMRHGNQVHFARLNKEKIKLAKLLHSFFKWPKNKIAKLFNVEPRTLGRAVNGETWKHLN